MSLYAESLAALFKNFKKENILIIKYEQLEKKESVVGKIKLFL